MKLKRLIYGSLLSLSLFTTCSLFSVVAATNGVVGVYSGNECLAAEFDKVDGATYKAYIKGEGITSYQELDSELIREVNGNIRVDALGLAAGTYSLKLVINNSDEIEITNITVNADDRSGYAHFNYTDGVGAYKDDGTLKDNAQVIYVTDSNKNDVDGNGNSLYDYLSNASASNPLDVRIIGEIKTRQWDYVNTKSVFGEGKTDTRKTNLVNYYYKEAYLDDWNYIGSNTYNRLYEEDIKKHKLNTMNNDSSIVELDGLTNYISYVKDSSKDAYQCFDTYFNMMDVKTKSNITIEGIGTDAEIFQWGFTFSKCDSIEVKNLTFTDYPEDAIGFEGKDNSDMDYGNYWIHNCTFNEGKNNLDVTYENDKTDGDGSSDLKFAHNLTISYCKYNGTHKTNLLGSSNTASQYNITLHHNYYNGCKARLPLVRQANVHIYNNYYSGTTSTGISVRAHAYAFIENNYFDGKNPFMLAYKTSDKFDPTGTTIKAIGNEFGSSVTVSAIDKDTDQGLGLMDNGIYVLTTKDTASYESITTISNITRTTTSTRSICTNNNTDYANFDTNSALFYYENNQSNVTVMKEASDLPEFIPTVAGAGKLQTTTYTIPGGSSNEPVYDNTSYAKVLDEDFGVEKTINTTASTPTTAGIYHRTNATNYDKNYVNVDTENKQLVIYDNSDKTTYGYYMFNNSYTTGKVVYNVNITLGQNVGSKWNIVQFLDGNSNITIRSCGNGGNDDPYKNKWGYSIDGGTNEIGSSLGVSKETTYTIVLTIDYDNQTAKVSINGTELTITGWNFVAINGIQFMTADSATDRSFYVNSISITRETSLKLGYQLGSYTNNNTEYYALRIIGKIEYNDVYADLDVIDSININIKIENASGVQTKELNKDITNVYKSLKISNGTTITETGDNLRYYYTVIKGITSSYSGYKIKASTTLTLKNGVKVECSGFAYEVQ